MDAVRQIEDSDNRMTVVVDANNKLIGTITDGDVRRSLLNGATLDNLAMEICNQHPQIAEPGLPETELLRRMEKANVPTLPSVDEAGRFLGLVTKAEVYEADASTNNGIGLDAAIIMAGGQGMRLRPLTENLPKPLMDIGGTPLLGHMVLRLALSGVKRIFVSINYLGHLIEDYLGDGRRFGISIKYIRENEPMGTAGALSEFQGRFRKPVLVMNGDILTNFRFENFAAYHIETGADVSVAAIKHMVKIPYGVIHTRDDNYLGIEEKPTQQYLCNAGMYVLSPEAFCAIPQKFYNMTDLIDLRRAQGKRVAVFPVYEYWSDIGTVDDLEATREKVQSEAII